MAYYEWKIDREEWRITIPNDGVMDFCSCRDCEIDILMNNAITPIQKERLLTLSSGKTGRNVDWYKVNKMKFFRTRDDEIIKRTTFIQEDNVEALTELDSIYSIFKFLINEIVTDSTHYPNTISSLKVGAKITFKDDNKYNLFTTGTNPKAAPATVAFIGNQSEYHATDIYNRIGDAIGTQYIKRVVVWYFEGGQIKHVAYVKIPNAKDSGYSGVDIAKDG